MTHAWLRYPPTGGYFNCPLDALNSWKDRGWEPCDAPAEVDETTAHWPKPEPVPAAPAAKKNTSATTAKAGNEEKIDG